MKSTLALVRLTALVLPLLIATAAHAEKVTLIAGGGTGADGGPAVGANVEHPFGIIFDKTGNLYIGQFGGKTSGQLVRKIDTRGIITTIAGTGTVGFSGDGGPASSAQFNFIHDIVIGPDQNLYVADSFNKRVRKIDTKTGIITTFAGNNNNKGQSSAGDGGPAHEAVLDGVASLWFSGDGATLYISGFSKVVRTVDMKSGIINTVKDCPGGRSIALDSKGNLYVAGGNSLSVRSPDGTVKTLLDKTHTGGAEIGLGSNPKHLGIDAQDNVLICDEQHNMLRKYIVAEAKLVTLMGTGTAGTAGLDGPPAQAQLKAPHGVLFHNGMIYVADSMNDRVLKIEP